MTEYYYLYLVYAGIPGMVLVYFTVEAFHRSENRKRNLIFLTVNSLVLGLLINQFREVFFTGVGQWGINPESQNRGIIPILPSLGSLLFYSIILVSLIVLMVGLRTIGLALKQKGK